MSLLQSIRGALVYNWQGPPDLPRSLKLELRFVGIRWLGIIFVTPGLMLARLPADRLLGAYAVLAFAVAYNLVVHWMIRNRPALIANGYVTTVTDGLLNVAIITVAGGFDSPLYYILYTVTIAAAMRYGYGPALGMAFMFVGFDAVEGLAYRDGIQAPFIFRSSFLCLTAILAGYLREQAVRAEAALHERLRQANLLNEATAPLAASLELETVLRSVLSAAARVYGSPGAVLQLAADHGGEDSVSRPIITYPACGSTSECDELVTLCGEYVDAEVGGAGNDQLIRQRTLRSGQQAVVLNLFLPTRQTALAVLALMIPATRKAAPTLDPDILDSLVKRVTLAIENATLYRALARRSGDLQRAYADLELAHQELVRVDEMKTNFLANVSHEFRTPLTSIRSFSELLLSYEDDPTLQREFLEIINTESERLTRMVNDVLDITQIEAGHLDWHMTTVDVASLIHESGRTYARVIEQQNLTFQEEVSADLPAIRGDHDRLQQVIGNLLNNALKFTRAGTIKLSAWRHGDEILISVTDTGVGISPKDHERIFEKFQQVGAMLTDKPRGAGLGLSICREIVEHHQGRIWVDSKPGGGSTFTFSLQVVPDFPHLPGRPVGTTQAGEAAESREAGREQVIAR